MQTPPRKSAELQRLLGWGLLALLVVCSPGCVRAIALMGKVVLGDPKAVSKFEDRTGIKLQEDKPPVIIHCSAPLTVLDVCESLTGDVEAALIRNLKQKELTVIDQKRVVEAIDSRGGHYNQQAVIEEIEDAKYIFEIRIESFQLHDPNTSSMYHGICRGTIKGYEIMGASAETGSPSVRHTVQVFEQDFDVDYPNGHPMPREQMSQSIFRKKFVNELTKKLGNIFYDVTSKELF